MGSECELSRGNGRDKNEGKFGFCMALWSVRKRFSMDWIWQVRKVNEDLLEVTPYEDSGECRPVLSSYI